MSEYVYFIRPVGKAGPIKIGHSVFPPARLISLQAWSYEELEIISQLEGGRKMERAIHERFAKYQIRGEWFEAVPDLVVLAEGIRDGKALRELVDLSVWTGKFFRRPPTKSPEAKVVGTYKMRVDRAAKYASYIRRKHVAIPRAVKAILDGAGGYRQAYRLLSEDEISKIEVFIAECRAPRRVGTTSEEVAA
jgi:hypothetical protein